MSQPSKRLQYGSILLTYAVLSWSASCTGRILGAEQGADLKAADSGMADTDANAGLSRESERERTPGEPDNSSGPTAVSRQPSAAGCDDGVPDPGPNPLRRLTRSQYINSVRELLGEVSGLDVALGPAVVASELGLVQPDVAPVELEIYQVAAETVASAVVSDAGRLKRLAPCAAGAAPRACAQRLVQTLAARAYRAPLADDADVERHMALYDLGAAESHAHGLELVLRGVLQAPRFLYRVELGTAEQVGDKAVALSSYELAARLSYVFWDSTPNDRLWTAAESWALTTLPGLAAALDDVLDDTRGRAAVRRFLFEWLHLSQLDTVVKDTGRFPEWDKPGHRSALRDQAVALLDDVLLGQAGDLPALLSTRTTFASRELSTYYASVDMQLGEGLTPITLAQDRAAGVLTLPAFLAVTAKPTESSPIYRGKFVREALLCQALPAPPANIPRPPEVTPTASTRARLAQHERDPACSGCHQLMDPIGFAFEHFDAVGKHRDEDGGRAVDTSGELIGTDDADGHFSGLRELVDKLVASDEVHACMVRQWFRFALGRFERPADACTLQKLVDDFERNHTRLSTLPSALVDSAAFRYRRPLNLEDEP